MSHDQRSHLKHSRRIVVKIGSAIMKLGGKQAVSRFAAQAQTLRDEGREVIFVSSGAIALGLSVLGYARRPTQVHQLQAAAAAGQFELMSLWSKALKKHGAPVAQVLLTHADLASRERFLNSRHALLEVLRCGAVPIINENDSVATDEIRVGDNDSLSAQVASLLGADLLIILTTVDGLYTANPETSKDAERIRLVDNFEAVRGFASGVGSTGLGVGGMHTKIEAARAAVKRAIPVVIAHGQQPHVLTRCVRGDDVGTLFVKTKALQSRKHWISFTLKTKGTLQVDSGAAAAIVERGKSLLPSGITEVSGNFHRGAMVEICGPKGCIARGLAAYSADELRQLKGRNSREIEAILGYIDTREVVHRDDLVLVE